MPITELCAGLFYERNIIVDGVVAYTEAGDHIAYYSAQSLALFKYGGLKAMLLGVVGSGKSCGAAAYNCDLLTLAAHLGYSQQLLERSLCRLKLCAADIHGTLVVVAHTLIHAVMGAYGTGDKGQGVLCGYNLQCLKEQALAAQLYVFGVYPDPKGQPLLQGALKQSISGSSLPLPIFLSGASFMGLI